jgi:KaiC/GvpD/RAD55 family RecA-like ATPase
MSEGDEEIFRAGTGVPGLDELIQGGYPKGGVHMVSGPPGSGKSLLGMQFLLEGARKGESGMYISLEEREINIYRAMKGVGIDIHAPEIKGNVVILDLAKLRKDYINQEEDVALVDFRNLVRFFYESIRIKVPSRLVIDSLAAVGIAYSDENVFRQDLMVLCNHLREEGFTTLILTEAKNENGTSTRFGIEGFLGDSFVALSLENIKGELQRGITIRKMRFTDHDKAVHPVFIGKGGMTVKSDAGVF